jgi:hypothetical protein
MAKKKKATKPTSQQIVTVFVPDAVYNLGDGMNELIGKINFLWATPFGVQEVDVSPASALPVSPVTESTRTRHPKK